MTTRSHRNTKQSKRRRASSGNNTFTITGLPPDEDAEHYDKYEKERTTEINTGITAPIVDVGKGDIPRKIKSWTKPKMPKNKTQANMEAYNDNLTEHKNRKIMIQYVHNMIQTAMCLLKNNIAGYTVKYIASGVNGATYKLTYQNKQRAVKFQLFNTDFPLEQKTSSKFNAIPGQDIAVKIHKYCYVYFPVENFHVAIIEMDLIDGTLSSLLSNNVLSEETVSNLADQVLTILDTMNNYQLSHCDMHPGNIAYKILPDNKYKVLLIDFGWGAFNSDFSDIDFLSLLRGALRLGESDSEQLFAKIIYEQAEDYLSTETYNEITYENDSGETVINPDRLGDYYIKLLRGDYTTMKDKLADKIIRTQARRSTQTVTGAIGPSHSKRRLPARLNTRSKYQQTFTITRDSPSNPQHKRFKTINPQTLATLKSPSNPQHKRFKTRQTPQPPPNPQPTRPNVSPVPRIARCPNGECTPVSIPSPINPPSSSSTS
jgi:hypothetical protein